MPAQALKEMVCVRYMVIFSGSVELFEKLPTNFYLKSDHMNMKIGCHVSIAGGIQNAPKRAADLGCEIFQLFTRSPQGGPAPELTRDVVAEFKEEMKKWKQEDCYIHTPYYINFASVKENVRKASVKVVREELERGSSIGAKYVMTHLGSAKDYINKAEALDVVVQSVNEIMHGYKGETIFLLEISAGSGDIIGSTFEELHYIISKTTDKIGVCIDSAHVFASGYDIKTEGGFDEVAKNINNTVGLNAVKLIHANDSMVDLGEKKDRHEHIGDGKIGLSGFNNLIKQFPNIDMILETDHNKVEDDIRKLKKLRG
jgi:deoxyribonuclease-4